MYKFEVKPNPNHSSETPNTPDHFIEFVEEKYKGMQFNIGKIEFAGEDENGNGKINFDYNLLFIPEGVNYTEEREEIEAAIAATLQQILEQVVKNETGNDDTQQSTEG